MYYKSHLCNHAGFFFQSKFATHMKVHSITLYLHWLLYKTLQKNVLSIICIESKLNHEQEWTTCMIKFILMADVIIRGPPQFMYYPASLPRPLPMFLVLPLTPSKLGRRQSNLKCIFMLTV